MFKSSIDTIEEFKTVLKSIPRELYDEPCRELAEATIGKHTRHIIELYQCLIEGYESGDVCYDNRKRDVVIETNIEEAIVVLEEIQDNLIKPDKKLTITYGFKEGVSVIPSNYYREVLYNLEHAIHHHALIKIGIQKKADIRLPETFGVAPATVQYRKLCAQ